MYEKHFLDTGNLIVEVITENEFNQLVVNNENILPIHHFTIKRLTTMLSDFVIEDTIVFHELYPRTFFDSFLNRDVILNFPFIRNFAGRDVCVLARKK